MPLGWQGYVELDQELREQEAARVSERKNIVVIELTDEQYHDLKRVAEAEFRTPDAQVTYTVVEMLRHHPSVVFGPPKVRFMDCMEAKQ